ncbi:DNA recombination protein RmuC [Kitasatospora sp. MAP5-34]|uniref:DNA recombination protein RmuC n=1 Tax=Kitasatospora sp. MAP5-34 TaxID=3035102 RepID=UPI0024743694|nr:DNA recombination protein RmuC [Kitasatospora sp. MAP5-34]MDH6578851.1 DNA recombination protein RmuC [Kitasatospora sp. MAP5-34]
MNQSVLTPAAVGLLAALLGSLVGFVLAHLRTAAAQSSLTTDLRAAEDRAERHQQNAQVLQNERDRERARADTAERTHAAALADHRSRDEQLGRLTAELSTAQEKVSELREQRSRAEADGEQQDARAAKLVRGHQELREKYAGLETTNARLRDDLLQREQDLDVMRERQRAVEVAGAEITAARQQLVKMQEDQQRLLAEKMQTLSQAVVDQGSAQLLSAAEQQLSAINQPVQEQLQRMDQHLRDLEGKRAAAESRISEQIVQMNSMSEGVRKETQSLSYALRKPQVRGAWGEQHLQRTVELAGLVEHCDFETQVSVTDDDGTSRPDLVVHLAGGKQVVVDAKVPLTAFMDAMGAPNEEAQRACYKRHAKLVRQHVDALSGKEYHRKLPCTPEFVALYLPGEGFLERALEADPQLMEYAAGKRVLVATPTILSGMLRAVAFAWSQAALADSMREVSDLGRTLYERLAAMGKHLEKLGRAMDSSVKAYNDTVASLEGRVLVTARKFQGMKVVESDLASPKPLVSAVRALAAPELTARETAASGQGSAGTGALWVPSQPKRPSPDADASDSA